MTHSLNGLSYLDFQLVCAAFVGCIRRSLDGPLELCEVVPDEAELNAGGRDLLAADDLPVLPLDPLRGYVRHGEFLG